MVINPDRTKPWNQLPDLPPPNEKIENIAIFKKLVNARAALAELNGRVIAIPNPAMLISTISLQEAKSSTEIENIFTTNDELYKATSTSEKMYDGPAKEVVNYRKALWKGYGRIKKNPKIDRDFLLNIFRKITNSHQGLRHPSTPTVIRKGGSTVGAGQVVYTPPRGEGILEKKLDNLFEFLNDDKKYPIDPLLKMAIAHYQFEAIHPFSDGNGRTGRIINIVYLVAKGLLDLPVLYLSSSIIDNKSEYYERLGGVSQRADWKGWIIYILNAVENTAHNSLAKVNDILTLMEATKKRILKENKNLYSDKLLEAIFYHPYSRVNILVKNKVGAEKTIRKRLNLLAEMGVMEKQVHNGNHIYVNVELYNLLAQ
jgi:Fic family protein